MGDQKKLPAHEVILYFLGNTIAELAFIGEEDCEKLPVNNKIVIVILTCGILGKIIFKEEERDRVIQTLTSILQAFNKHSQSHVKNALEEIGQLCSQLQEEKQKEKPAE